MKEFSNSIPRWVRVLGNVLNWLDNASPKGTNWFWWRWDFIDDYCACSNCERRRSVGLQRPKQKWFKLF